MVFMNEKVTSLNTFGLMLLMARRPWLMVVILDNSTKTSSSS